MKLQTQAVYSSEDSSYALFLVVLGNLVVIAIIFLYARTNKKRSFQEYNHCHQWLISSANTPDDQEAIAFIHHRITQALNQYAHTKPSTNALSGRINPIKTNEVIVDICDYLVNHNFVLSQRDKKLLHAARNQPLKIIGLSNTFSFAPDITTHLFPDLTAISARNQK